MKGNYSICCNLTKCIFCEYQTKWYNWFQIPMGISIKWWTLVFFTLVNQYIDFFCGRWCLTWALHANHANSTVHVATRHGYDLIVECVVCGNKILSLNLINIFRFNISYKIFLVILTKNYIRKWFTHA